MSNQTRNSSDTIDAQIGEAWAFHYKKQNEQALAQFERLVQQDPAHIDALYGLSLVQATLGKAEEAKANFTRLAALVRAKQEQLPPESEDSRYSMLTRMIDQHLQRLG